MGAWIEILYPHCHIRGKFVAPYMGAWIEMILSGPFFTPRIVAPYMGAWIEILVLTLNQRITTSRSLHGSVD